MGYRLGTKNTVEDCYSINTRFLKEYGYLKPTQWSRGNIVWRTDGEEVGKVDFIICTTEKFIEFHYKTRSGYLDEEWQSKSYRTNLLTTGCHFGGVRYWFECMFCKRRVGTLYLCGDSDFACRHCLDLSYTSRNENKQYRNLEKVFSIGKIEDQIYGLRTKTYRGRPTRKLKKLLLKREWITKAFAPLNIDRLVRL